MKNTVQSNTVALTILFVCLIAVPGFGQQDSTAREDNKPARPAFEGTMIIENQSVLVPQKGTFEFMLQHRFGTVGNGISDLWGIWAPSNIRIGFNYTLFSNVGFGNLKGALSIGFGTTKDNRVQDFSVKYNFLQQTRSGSMPVSVTYYGNTAIETQNTTEKLPNGNESDRLSFFHQILVARRFSPKISAQVGFSLSHYNVVQPFMQNDHYAVAFSGRYKFSPQSSVMVNVDQPITAHLAGNPAPNVSLGVEIATSGHSFQIFFTNYRAIVPQRNNVYNQNSPESSDGFLIGFNINRIWNL
jgi:Membrane bound beta barrel domain (DUF5777)